ncbi:unnamed protein product [Effrenium voratum]|uniref:Uncharacterized protein n=1 Tax=Effrenium voratum TaxID=2562239 RepID=A0AA36HWL2_9DINO|nr:unnamed protein product [Effrenium voratum]CAJ1376401.1 unnamed protein product [Effrenium voratum]
MLPLTPGRYQRRSRVVARLTNLLLQFSIATGTQTARRVLLCLILLVAWVGLYGDLLGAGYTNQALQHHEDSIFARVGFRLSVLVAILLVGESTLILVYGTVVYGSVFLMQKAFVLGFFCSSSIVTLLLLARYAARYSWLIYAVPVCASLRLLLIPVIRAERVKFTRMVEMARCQSLSLETIQKAIRETPERVLSQKQRKRLLRLAEQQDQKQGRDFWEEADVSRFLRDAGAELSEHSGAAGTAALLSGVVARIGGTNATFNNYGIFATFSSGCWYLLTSAMGSFMLFAVSCFLDGCIGPLQAAMISSLTEAIIVRDESAALRHIACYAGTQLLNLVCYTALVISYSQILARGTACVQIHVAEKMLAMSSKYAATYGSGSINATFASDILRLQDLWTGVMWSLMSPLSRVLITIIYAFTVSPQVGVLALSVFPIIFVTVPQGSSSMLAASYSMAAAETIDIFQNGVSCQRMLWQCDRQHYWFLKYLQPLIHDQEMKHYEMRKKGGIVQGYVQQLVNVFVAVHIVLLAWLAVKGGITVAEFTGFVSLLSSLAAPSISLGSFYRVAVSCAGSVQRIDEFLDQESLPLLKTKVVLGHNGMDDTTHGWERQISPMQYGDVTVSHLCFRYPERNEFIINDVSLSIPAGKFVALVGGSGCGKSTLLSLLMTWLRPSSGAISLGENVSFDPSQGHTDDAARRLRKSISVVFQDKTLLRGTVLDNILISAPSGASAEDAEWAAQLAGCAEFITTSLPKAYDTLIGGADGVTLSGGQAQRLCIARALCRKPALLLLDEATSALDAATERHVLQTISSLRSNHPEEFGTLTIISVTHHLHTLEYCDMVVHLKSGGTVDHVEHIKK